MSTDEIKVGQIMVNVIWKNIKNIHLSVLPPNGNVRVSAPIGTSQETIKMLVASKLPWIKAKIQSAEKQPRQTERQYISGENHYLLGRKYRLEVVARDGKQSVCIKSKSKLTMSIRPEASIKSKHELMNEFYREQLRKIIPAMLTQWEEKLSVKIDFWGIKRMKTKWGTCNAKGRRVWFNLELAKKHLECIEYIVVHELLHLIDHKHDKLFVSLLDRYLPKWRYSRDLLNDSELSHEKWIL